MVPGARCSLCKGRGRSRALSHDGDRMDPCSDQRECPGRGAGTAQLDGPRKRAHGTNSVCCGRVLTDLPVFELPPVDSREQRSPMNLRTAISCVCSALVLLVGVQVVSAAPAPGVSWATKAGGTGATSGRGISALPDGSSIVTGYFYGTATFGSTTLTSSSAGINDVFVAKMNADGTWAWATQAVGSEYDYASGNSVSALPDGSSIVTGYFSDTATFGSTTLTSRFAWRSDVFTAKMNADGTWAWATQAGGTGSDYGKGISALPDGSSIVTGRFEGTATFGSTTLISAGSYDVFTARYLDAPQAPAAPVAVAGNVSAAVTITPLAGGSVTSYTVTSDPGEKTCTVVAPAISCTVEGLTNGTGYRFRATATNSAGTGAASAWSNAVTPADAVAKTVPLLRSSLTCRKTGVRTTCTTRGPVPPGVTAVTQRATTSAAPAAQSREMARPKVKTAKGTCRITKRGKGKKATRTYQCTIRLSKGKWTITTKALKKTTIIAQSVKTKKVK